MPADKFLRLPRLNLAPLDTPIEKMERLSKALGPGPSLYIKRDDFIGQLVWGNKLRKLEYTIAHALKEGADTLLTCGAVQSNHARTTAQVARRLNLDCILVLNGEEPAQPTGNYRIVKLMGTKVLLVKERSQRSPVMKALAEDLTGKGRKPFIIPLGASDEFGVPGFANAIREMHEQGRNAGIRFTHVYHSTSSGGTQAGLEAGKKIFGLEDITICGISADDPPETIKSKVVECANPLLTKLGALTLLRQDEINVFSEFVGEGYGIPTTGSELARKLFLEHEGILLDDTYTAKAADGLISHIRSGMFRETDNVLFWHTGGLINLF